MINYDSRYNIFYINKLDVIITSSIEPIIFIEQLSGLIMIIDFDNVAHKFEIRITKMRNKKGVY